eukprot:6455765-Amphidinium_carterae.1
MSGWGRASRRTSLWSVELKALHHGQSLQQPLAPVQRQCQQHQMPLARVQLVPQQLQLMCEDAAPGSITSSCPRSTLGSAAGNAVYPRGALARRSFQRHSDRKKRSAKQTALHQLSRTPVASYRMDLERLALDTKISKTSRHTAAAAPSWAAES